MNCRGRRRIHIPVPGARRIKRLSVSGAGLGIPRFRDVLSRYPSARCIIELKTSEPELVAARSTNSCRFRVDRVALGSFYWRALNTARAYEPRIPTGASKEETRWALYRSWFWPLGRTGYREFQVPEHMGVNTSSLRGPSPMPTGPDSGEIWTVNDEPDIRRLLDWGADALISDRPDLAVEAVKSLVASR